MPCSFHVRLCRRRTSRRETSHLQQTSLHVVAVDITAAPVGKPPTTLEGAPEDVKAAGSPTTAMEVATRAAAIKVVAITKVDVVAPVEGAMAVETVPTVPSNSLLPSIDVPCRAQLDVPDSPCMHGEDPDAVLSNPDVDTDSARTDIEQLASPMPRSASALADPLSVPRSPAVGMPLETGPSEPAASSDSPVAPSVSAPPSPTATPPRQMVTRRQNDVHRPRQFTDGTVRFSLLSHISSLSSSAACLHRLHVLPELHAGAASVPSSSTPQSHLRLTRRSGISCDPHSLPCPPTTSAPTTDVDDASKASCIPIPYLIPPFPSDFSTYGPWSVADLLPLVPPFPIPGSSIPDLLRRKMLQFLPCMEGGNSAAISSMKLTAWEDTAHGTPDETTTTPLTAEICAALRRELEPSPDDHSDLARCLRLTQHRIDHISARISSATPPPPSYPPPPQPLPPPPPHPRADTKRAPSYTTAKADPARAASAATPKADPARASSATTNADPKRALSATADPARGSSSSIRGRKRYRGMPSAEMVRATVPTEADILQVRTLTKRARLTFEALRGYYHRRGASENNLGGRNRADMRALSTMISRDLCLYRDKRIVGPVPGVSVGDAFTYRAELLVVGLHNYTQAGIGFVPASLVSEGHPVATSIVSSGGYLDDRDNGDVLVYTGSGGRPRNGGDHHADQAFERGNLALAYSSKYGVEVRVIRCHDCDASPSGKLYVYDGLYKVESSTYSPGKSGREVCRFNLVRLPGQDPLGSNTLRAARKLVQALASTHRLPGYLTLDLSRGKEAIRVPVCNNVDDDRSPLDDTRYIARPRLPPPPSTLERRRRCCSYKATASGWRSSSSSCACVKKNGGGGPPYNADGTLVRGVPVVYECGVHCVCSATCPNRVTQRGMKHRLEVFRSTETEWGVRTLDLIQPGAFICEFSGDAVAMDNAPGASTGWDGYVDPRKFPPRWKEWGDASAAALPDDDVQPPRFPQCPTPAYVLDVSERRNFAPYICHSGAPNTFVQFVVRADENESCPHVMVFAMETIPPMCELSIDYGIDQ
uniref:Uncharacterized protein n=1 Tax=Avena sativa TaxID=4498 RepID=A0ACD5WM58_AVESA